MRPRVTLGRFLNRFGRFIQSLDIMVMRPEDLVEYTRQTYSRPKNVEAWTGKDVVDPGLSPEEKTYLNDIPQEKGSLLLLGIGGGREAIPLAKRGFKVTGIDFVPDMVKKAKENALKRGVKIEAFVQNISEINFPASSYDIVWLSYNMYSCLPTRKRRIEMLRKIYNVLKPQGYFLCQFFWYTKPGFPKSTEIARKIFVFLTLGNLWYEKGDMLWGDREFIHGFSSEHLLKSEFEDGGFEVVKIYIPEESPKGAAILRRESLSNG